MYSSKLLHILSHLILTRTLELDTIIFPHFIDEKIEAQKE